VFQSYSASLAPCLTFPGGKTVSASLQLNTAAKKKP